MSAKDAIYYGGLIAGTIVGVVFMRQWTDNNLIQLGVGVALGVCCGFVAEQILTKSSEPPSQDSDRGNGPPPALP